jgi:hypothetical protein
MKEKTDKDCAVRKNGSLEKITELPEPERAMAELLQTLFTTIQPVFMRKTWHGKARLYQGR